VLFSVIAIVSVVVIAAIDPNWAIPANTALLVILALINRKTAKRADQLKKEVVDVKLKCGADRRDEDLKSISEVKDKQHTEPESIYGRRYTDTGTDEYPEVDS